MRKALVLVASTLVIAVAGVLVFVYVIQDVEQPQYQLVTRDGDIEVRDYPQLVVAEVVREGDRQRGLSAGFGPLASYIFARDRDGKRGGERIAMTAPVQQQARDQQARIAMTAPVTQSALGDTRWAVQFIMPSAYAIQDLPAPGGDDVHLREVPARRVAAVRFSGRTDDRLIAKQERRLRAWMTERDLAPAGVPIYAYYNDPLTPGFLRRNEVMIPLLEGVQTPSSG